MLSIDGPPRGLITESNYISGDGERGEGRKNGDAIRPTLRPTVSANAITQLNFQFSQTNAITSSNSALLFSNRPPPEFPKRKDGKVEGILASRGEKGGEASEFNRNFAALLDEKKIARITITQ